MRGLVVPHEEMQRLGIFQQPTRYNEAITVEHIVQACVQDDDCFHSLERVDFHLYSRRGSLHGMSTSRHDVAVGVVTLLSHQN